MGSGGRQGASASPRPWFQLTHLHFCVDLGGSALGWSPGFMTPVTVLS